MECNEEEDGVGLEGWNETQFDHTRQKGTIEWDKTFDFIPVNKNPILDSDRFIDCKVVQSAAG